MLWFKKLCVRLGVAGYLPKPVIAKALGSDDLGLLVLQRPGEEHIHEDHLIALPTHQMACLL